MAETAIEWAEKVWNPTTGCDRVSPGCDHCYALTMAKRLKGMGQAKYQRDGDPKTSGPGFGLAIHEDALTQPLKWRKPSKVFVNSMSDLFHKDVPDDFLIQVFAVMALTPRHTYQVLTKRHARMRSLLGGETWTCRVDDAVAVLAEQYDLPISHVFPLPNVWLGVSAEDQHWADIRIPALLETPAAVRWVSAEPLLSPILLADEWIGADPYRRDEPSISWLVAGGESGPGARPMHPDWARNLRDQCSEAGVPFFFKQFGSYAPVTDRPNHPDVWVRPDGSALAWERGDGHFRGGLGDFRQSDRRPSSSLVRKVGKKTAGRELDGRTWDEYPSTDRTSAPTPLSAGVHKYAPVELSPAPARVASGSSPLGEPDAFQTTTPAATREGL